MQKLLILLLCLSLVFVLVSCGRSEYAMERDAKEEAIYDRGYEAGYEAGEWEGIMNAQERFEDYAHWEIVHDIENKYRMSPEEAINILEFYADGDPVTEFELNQAIWTMSEYYWKLYWAIGDIDNYIQ